jgi:hypothetical protein
MNAIFLCRADGAITLGLRKSGCTPSHIYPHKTIPLAEGRTQAVSRNLTIIYRKKAECVCTLPPDRRYSSWIAAHRPVPGRSQRMGPHFLHPSEKSGLLARVCARVNRALRLGDITFFFSALHPLFLPSRSCRDHHLVDRGRARAPAVREYLDAA